MEVTKRLKPLGDSGSQITVTARIIAEIGGGWLLTLGAAPDVTHGAQERKQNPTIGK